MNAQATLKLNGKDYDIHRMNYKFERDIDAKGRPCSCYYGGSIVVEFESTDDMSIFRNMIDEDMPVSSGEILVTTGEDGFTLRHLIFSDAYIYAYGEQMNSTSGLPMITAISISPIRLDVNKKLRLNRRWPEANGWEVMKPEEVKVAQKPIEQEAEVAEIKITTPLTKRNDKEGIELNKSHTLKITQYTNGAPKDINTVRWQYSYTADDGSITVVGLPNTKGNEVEIVVNKANILSRDITFKAYINDDGGSCKANIIPVVPNGVFVWVETKGTGHVFVSVQYNDVVYVYTYGRYDDGKGPYGEGVLIKYTNSEAEEYIKNHYTG